MSTVEPAPTTPTAPGGIDRRSLLRGAGLLGAVGATGAATLATSPAHAAPAPTPVSPQDFSLAADYSAYADHVESLLDQAGHASVSEVMDNANHQRAPARVLEDQAHGFRFAQSDENDPDAFPQGITTSRDAVGTAGNGRYDGRQLIAVSFYNNTPKSSRINLIDWDANYPNSYRRILLVEPTGSPEEPSFQDVTIHVGGITWYGDLLYVADTGKGMRVFDMSSIITTDTGGDKDQIGRVGNAFYAHHYAYALPQVGTISSQVAEGTASEALEVPLHYLNGVASSGGRWWFNQTNSTQKTLHSWPGDGEMVSFPWVTWGESLSFWPDENGPDLLWSLREGVGDRPVFAVEQADYSA